MGEETETTIRPAGTSDAQAIARVHVASWQQAYAGIVPIEYLTSLDPAEREQRWAEHLRNGPRDSVRTWVAEEAGTIVGFASVGPARDEDAERDQEEIYSIYLDPAKWGKGVARDLMRTVVGAFPAGTPMTLWVMADNARARHFYRRHGFSPDGAERLEDVGGAQLLEVRYRRG
jgi:ribosomal protein S18 acetylase RimI-like enzyme